MQRRQQHFIYVYDLGLCALALPSKMVTSCQVTWRWQPFNNPARTDNLALEHWVKCYKDQQGNIRPAEEGEYSFAKFNKKVACCARSPGCHSLACYCVDAVLSNPSFFNVLLP